MDSKKNKILEDVSGDKCFWVNNGPVVRNIYEFADALEHMTAASFNYHVTSQKNDFSNWIEGVLGDKELGLKIRHRSQQDAADAVRKKIYILEDSVERKKVEQITDESPKERLLELRKSRAETLDAAQERNEKNPERSDEKNYEPHKIEVRHSSHDYLHEKHNLSFQHHMSMLKESMKNNIELFLLGLVIGILIGKFVLGGF